MEYIQKWDFSWDKKKTGIVRHTIWEMLVHPDTKKQIDKLYVTRQKLSELTKTTTTLINELIKQNVLLKTELNDTFLVNQQKAYCKYCQYKSQKDNYLGDKRQDPYMEFYIWEINDHLERFHHMDGSSEYNKITPETIKEKILFKKPQFKFQEHKYTVKEIDTRLNTTYLVLYCSICKEEKTIRSDIEPCNNYDQITN